VIGGGTAGISAALHLAERGVFVNIVEKAPCLGGKAAELCCKGKDECVRCDVCLSMDKLYDVAKNRSIRVFSNTEVRKVTGKPGDFRVTLERKPRFVDERACTACGLCTQACPVEGGAIRPQEAGFPRTYRILEELCIRWNGEDCWRCVEACPNQAIDFSPRSSIKRLNVGAIVLATGFEPFDASRDVRLGCGELADVISSSEAERIVNRTGRLLVPSTGKEPRRVAFVMCVGSRDETRGVDYCSKVCCKYSYGLARLLRALHPELDISFFFMDWRPYDLKGDDLFAWSLRDDHLKLVRGRPAEIIPSEEGKPAVRFVDVQGRSLEEEVFDLVLLAVGIVPSPDLPLMADMLGVQLSERGFVHSSEDRPTVTSRPGVFAAGCCRGPVDIQESVMDGVTAAGEAMAFLGGLS